MNQVFLRINGKMLKSWYGEILMWLDDLNMSICFGGVMVILFCGVFKMLKCSNDSSSYFGSNFHWWWFGEIMFREYGEMVNKINSKMNFMVIFDWLLGYHIGFSILSFHSEWQFYWSWWLWGGSPVESMDYNGLPLIMSCRFYVLSNGELV